MGWMKCKSTTDSLSRLRSWDNRIPDILANGICDEEHFTGKILRFVSCLALGGVCYPVYVIVFWWWPEGRVLITQVVTADIAGLAVVVGLRYATRRQRPRRRRNHKYVVPWNRFSFPSGHAVRAFAVSVSLTCGGPVWCVLTLPVACVIAFSRIALALIPTTPLSLTSNTSLMHACRGFGHPRVSGVLD